MVLASIWSSRFSAPLYVEAMRLSDYEGKVGLALFELRREGDSILEVGAGDGGLSQHLWPARGAYVAVEIDVEMVELLRRRLANRAGGLASKVLEGDWRKMDWGALGPVDTGFAANTAGLVEGAVELWQRFRMVCRERIIWVVPAQRGPRSWCLSGLFPADVHGLSERPGVEIALEALASVAPEPQLRSFDWSFRQRFASPEAARRFVADKLEGVEAERWWPILEGNLKQDELGWIASAPKRSALLVWDL